MRQKTGPQTSTVEKTIKDIRCTMRTHHSAESLYSSWSKEFFEAVRGLYHTLSNQRRTKSGVVNAGT